MIDELHIASDQEASLFGLAKIDLPADIEKKSRGEVTERWNSDETFDHETDGRK